jgi:hypothetical protein
MVSALQGSSKPSVALIDSYLRVFQEPISWLRADFLRKIFDAQLSTLVEF